MFYLLNDLLCPLHAPTKLKRLLCLAGLWFSVILVPVFILFQAFEVSRPLCISATCSISISWFSFYLLVVLSLHGPLLSRDLCAHSSIIFWFPAFPAIWQYIFFRPPLFLVYRFDFSYCITAFIFQTCISVGAPLWASCKDGKARPLWLWEDVPWLHQQGASRVHPIGQIEDHLDAWWWHAHLAPTVERFAPCHQCWCSQAAWRDTATLDISSENQFQDSFALDLCSLCGLCVHFFIQ